MSKTAEETMTSKKLFARLLAKYIGIDEDPDIATEMIGKDIEVTALYNTCLEFSAICNDLTQQQLAEKDKEIEMFAIGFAKWIRENGYGYSEKFNLYQKSLINKTIFFYEKELIELYKQSLNK